MKEIQEISVFVFERQREQNKGVQLILAMLPNVEYSQAVFLKSQVIFKGKKWI